MRQFKYVGPHDAVEVYGLGVVERGHTVDVFDTAISAGLSDQPDNWQHIPARTPPKKKKKAAQRTPPPEAVEAADPQSPTIPPAAPTHEETS